MRIKDTLMIQNYVKKNRNRSIWRKLVRSMACVVVFCTVYALILPVITIEQTYICGMEAHEHTEQCAAGAQNGTLLCSAETLGVHSHNSGCYAEDGTLQCGKSDQLLHTHDARCYGADQKLQCQLPEVKEHRHGDGCYSGDALVCGRQELYKHSHGDSCLDENGSLICGALAAKSHSHGDDCPVLVVEGTVWICGMEEHTHGDTCLAPEAQPTETVPQPTGSTEPQQPSEVTEPSQPTESEIPATLTLRFDSGSWQDRIEFPGGGVYECRVGSQAVISLRDVDRAADYAEPKIEISGGRLLRVVTTCDVGHTDHEELWYDCGLSHEITIEITEPNAVLTATVAGDTWPAEGNRVTIDGRTWEAEPPVSTEPSEPTEPTGTEPTEPSEPTEVTEPSESTEPTDPMMDPVLQDPANQVDPYAGESDTPKAGYPMAVKTGNTSADTLYFYNFEATSSAVKPLAGCFFEIRSTDGTYVRQITSGNTLEIELPADIPVGDYTITQLSAPYGYLRDDNYTRSFSIGTSTTLGGQKVFKNNTIGSFMNHSLEDVNAQKTAEVENYNNRTYEIILSAGASVKLYEMEPIDVLFVVDQSNSMLFPSGLQTTGKSITLYESPETHEGHWTWGGWVPETNDNTTPMENLGLDKNQVYYIIADPQGTSTVFAVWHDGTSWMYQDASYYAKAWHDNREGYRQANETAVFPQHGQPFQGTWTDSNTGVNYKANGGDLGYQIGGSLGTYIGANGSKTFEIYTAVNEYNRLHYLEESITQAVYQLSDANVENTVTVIRFTNEVDEAHCMGPLEMTPENANDVVEAVNKIQTDGGTRQDLALEHAYNHLIGNITYKDGSNYDKYTKDINHTFTILITDGAPVRSGSNAPSLDTIYSQIRSNGAKVRQESTLITIGLGMDNVQGGKQVLEDIASEPHSLYANMLDDASDLTNLLHDLIFSSMTPKKHDAVPGEITDVISDSFYPIAWVPRGQGGSTGRELLFADDPEQVADARDWVVLEPGDWIDVNGRYLGPNQGETGEGQLTRDANGDLVVRWKDRKLDGEPSWSGRFYVKAKEDFIGGNAIDTNKSATVEIRTTDNSNVIARMDLPDPTVNVRLLDLNKLSSEVTVFLGDIINEEGNSPLNALEYFYYNTRFTKLIADLENSHGVDYGIIMNAVDPDAADDGLEKATFSLRYAMGKDLTAEQWEHLMASENNTVRVEYTYDNASSHGPVGYFTFRLTKSGETADYDSHEATVAGDHVEDYILHVTYTAYELGDNRPDANVHNGSGSPGTEVADENGNGKLEEGYGIVDKDNVHIVNVISGAIEVTKEITAELVSDADQTFHFTLHRTEDGDDHSGDRTLEVVIPAGQTTATVRADNLPRGTWVLSEQASDVYNIQALTILTTTNCYSVNDGTTAVFHIGDGLNDQNVIGKAGTARYTSYTGSPEGVFGAAKVVNEKTVYYGEIPVKKVWGGMVPSDPAAAVYVVLYRTVDGVEQLMLDTEGHARLLRLDAANNWQGTFRVALPEKDAKVETLGYFVREVRDFGTNAADRQSAILENDGTTLVYYGSVAGPEELLQISGSYFMVTYAVDDTTGESTVTNHYAVELPSTGGPGTTMYTFSGLLLLAAALIIGYSRLRRREKGGEA